MFSVDESVAVNTDLEPGDPVLTRDQVWEGLLMKARNAEPFVHLMTYCEVTKELPDGLERDIVFRDMALTERVVFHPKTKVKFIRTKGIELGTITNELYEDERGRLQLRFAFTLERADLESDSNEEREFAREYGRGYLVSVQKTIDAVRELVRSGELVTH